MILPVKAQPGEGLTDAILEMIESYLEDHPEASPEEVVGALECAKAHYLLMGRCGDE